MTDLVVFFKFRITDLQCIQQRLSELRVLHDMHHEDSPELQREYPEILQEVPSRAAGPGASTTLAGVNVNGKNRMMEEESVRNNYDNASSRKDLPVSTGGRRSAVNLNNNYNRNYNGSSKTAAATLPGFNDDGEVIVVGEDPQVDAGMEDSACEDDETARTPNGRRRNLYAKKMRHELNRRTIPPLRQFSAPVGDNTTTTSTSSPTRGNQDGTTNRRKNRVKNIDQQSSSSSGDDETNAEENKNLNSEAPTVSTSTSPKENSNPSRRKSIAVAEVWQKRVRREDLRTPRILPPTKQEFLQMTEEEKRQYEKTALLGLVRSPKCGRNNDGEGVEDQGAFFMGRRDENDLHVEDHEELCSRPSVASSTTMKERAGPRDSNFLRMTEIAEENEKSNAFFGGGETAGQHNEDEINTLKQRSFSEQQHHHVRATPNLQRPRNENNVDHAVDHDSSKQHPQRSPIMNTTPKNTTRNLNEGSFHPAGKSPKISQEKM